MNDGFKHFLLGIVVIIAILLFIRNWRKTSGARPESASATAGGKKGGCGCGGGCGGNGQVATHDGTTTPTAGNTGVNQTSDGSHYAVWGGTN